MDETGSDLLNFIKGNEGFRSKKYPCPAGKWTFGYGYNAQAHGIPAKYVDAILSDRGVTEEEAEELLIDEVADCITACEKIVPGFSTLSENRKIAMVDMCFNLGSAGLAKFKTMLECIGRGDFEGAARAAINSKWYKQVKLRGVRVVKLIREG